MKRSWLRATTRTLAELLCRMEVIGIENVPSQGGVIIATNHLSRLDPALVFAYLDRDDVSALVADKYKRYPLIPWLIDVLHGIWINREEADFRAIRAASQYLRQGGILGISPEGTRSPTRTLQPAKTGVAYLADKAGVPIVPVAITGTEQAIGSWLKLRRPGIRLLFGRPFCLESIERQHRNHDLQRNTDEIMCRIAALLPSGYRGVYHDHPRLRQLLEENSPSGHIDRLQTGLYNGVTK